VAESCPTKIFLANPDMNREVYSEAFHLNETGTGPYRRLVPHGAKCVIRQGADLQESAFERRSVSHWMATNNARDNLKKQEYFDRHGFADGLRHLAKSGPFQSARRGCNHFDKQPLRSALCGI